MGGVLRVGCLWPLLVGLAACPRPDGGTGVDAAVAALRARGRSLFLGRAGCTACHSVGRLGGRIIGPNLGVGDGMTKPVAIRARTRRPEMSPIAYLVESILAPDAFVVPGYPAGVMKAPDLPPISLTDDQVVAVAVYLASVGRGAVVRPADVERARAAVPRVRRSRARVARARGRGTSGLP